MAVLHDITAPYGFVEAFVYDLAIAPAVATFRTALDVDLAAELPRGARLLDVGCGGGQIAIDVARERPDLEVTGLDLAPSQVARATDRARRARVSARFVQGSALALPFDDGAFDAVLSVASIKHWPDRARGLAECARVLRPGGALGVIEADRGCSDEAIASFVDRWRIPAAMRPLARVMFRARVAGPSLDLEEARALAAALPLDRLEVRRLPGTPALAIRGSKRA